MSETTESIVFFSIVSALVLWVAKMVGLFRYHPAKPEESAHVSVKQLGTVFALYIGISMFVAPLLVTALAQTQLFRALPSSPLLVLGWTQFFSLALLVFALLFFCFGQNKTTVRKIWKDRNFAAASSTPFDMGVGALTWLVAFPVVNLVGDITDSVLRALTGYEVYEQVAVRYLKSAFNTLPTLLIALITILIIAPLIEELLFRGFLQTWIKKHLGARAAIPIASFCFAAFHYSESQGYGNIPLVLSLFTLACFLGLVYERQRSLFASISLHMTFNAVSTLRIFFQE
jgi:membrane protease YdiL (CAAX protease family)